MGYKTARVFAVFAVTFFVLFMLGGTFSGILFDILSFMYRVVLFSTPDVGSIAALTAIISVLGMILAMIGTASTVLIGWRAGRRQFEQWKLQSEEDNRKISRLWLAALNQTKPPENTRAE